MGGDYYERLGVSRDATAEAIASAYREKLKETHPDVSDASDAQERTKRLIEAKEVLTDEKERARYDRLGHEQYVTGGDAGPGTDGTTASGNGTTPRGSPGGSTARGSPGWDVGSSGEETREGPTEGTADRSRRRTRGWRQSGATEDFFDGWTTTGTDGEAEGTTPEDFWDETGGDADPREDRDTDETDTRGGVGDREVDPEEFFDDWAAAAEAASDPTGGSSGGDTSTASASATGPGGATASNTASTGGRRDPSTAGNRNRENSSVDWYSGTDDDDPHQRNGSWDAMTHGIHSPWPGGGVAETYAVRHERDHTDSDSLVSTDRVLFMIGFTFVIYPTLLFGAFFPLFPVSLRVVIAGCALVVTAFLQSMPQIGLFVFGTWSVLIPVFLTTTGVSLLAAQPLLLLTAVLFPFLFSLLTWLTVQPRSL